MTAPAQALTTLTEGMAIPFGGDRLTTVDADLAAAFAPGDALYVVQETGALLHVPARVREAVRSQVDAAVDAFHLMRTLTPASIASFFRAFADHLEQAWGAVQVANDEDVRAARERGRSTTRLAVSDRVRDEMAQGLRGWAQRLEEEGSDALSRRLDVIDHDTWSVETLTAPLGVIAFVFEGRPNVLADAAGVLASGNTAVLRIGGDALGTAQAIRDLAMVPALREAGLPDGALAVVPVRDRCAGWALFSDSRLALAVTRGSGRAVQQLSAVARQAGVPVSAHGTGGAWIVADTSADPSRLRAVVRHSLDRKVCNTVNVVVLPTAHAAQWAPLVLDAADEAAAARGGVARIHVVRGSEGCIDPAEFERRIGVHRAEGIVEEARASLLGPEELGREWEWEDTPELTLLVTDDLDQAIDAFNRWSPQFVASLVGEDTAAQDRFLARTNAPFVGDGFTRWVDGQYALDQPELGLSNWERGRLLARGGVLTGADLTTRRLLARTPDPDQHR